MHIIPMGANQTLKINHDIQLTVINIKNGRVLLGVGTPLDFLIELEPDQMPNFQDF